MNITDYILAHRRMLTDMQIWKRLSSDEKQQFKACITEIQVDNMMTKFRRYYL